MAIPTDSRVIESTFNPRRVRWVRYPWLARSDRIRSVPNLDHGLIDRRQLPLRITPHRDWLVFYEDYDYDPPDDIYTVGPLCRRGSQVRYVLIKTSHDMVQNWLTGWRLYFTRTAPAGLGDLLDNYEVYPRQRLPDGTPVPSMRFVTGYMTRVSPDDHVKWFPGYYTFRWTDPGILFNKCYWRIIIQQPVPEL